MTRYKAVCDYKGTDFAGWQVQPKDKTVQGEIEKALFTFYREKIRITGCGRTDAGVHAKNYVFHFDAESTCDKRDLKGINAILPQDISIHDLCESSDSFHARYDCFERTYEYYIHLRKDPLINDWSYHYPLKSDLNIHLLNEAAQILIGHNEFHTFCKSNSGLDKFDCHLYRAEWELIETHRLKFTITSNRFLRGMVRLIVGMCLRVAEGKMTLDKVSQAFEKKESLSSPWSVPASGLILCNLKYPETRNTKDISR